MKSPFFIFVIICQITVIIILGFRIYQKKKNILGAVNINPIRKEDIVLRAEKLNYFYEPKPNSLQEQKLYGYPYKGRYTINSDSLNERFEYEVVKPGKTFRVITLGDSFTLGAYVDTKDNWTERLEDLLNGRNRCADDEKFEVINLGMGGYDIQYSVERFRVRGQKYRPDLVIWFLKYDDFKQINDITMDRIKKYEIEMKETGEYEEELKAGNLYPDWKKAQKEIIDELGEVYFETVQRKLLNDFKLYYSGSLLIITFSSLLDDNSKKILLDFQSSREKTYIYDGITNTIASPETHFPTDDHPNLKGHQLITNDVFNYLVQNKLIPCVNN